MDKTPREVVREREQQIWRLRQLCLTNRQISEAVGVSQPSVCRALARVEGRVLADLGEQVRSLKAQQGLQLENLAAQAYLAWEASKKAGRAAGVGDPRFLAETRSALADLRKVWGLDSPERLEVTGRGGKPIVTLPVSKGGQDDSPPGPDTIASILMILEEAGVLPSPHIEGDGPLASEDRARPGMNE